MRAFDNIKRRDGSAVITQKSYLRFVLYKLGSHIGTLIICLRVKYLNIASGLSVLRGSMCDTLSGDRIRGSEI